MDKKPFASWLKEQSEDNVEDGPSEQAPLVQNPFSEKPKINNSYGTGRQRYHSRESSSGSNKSTSQITHFHHDQQFEQSLKKRIVCASVFCLCYIVAEIIGASLSKSLALASDILIFLTDFGSLLIALLAVTLTVSPPSGTLKSSWYRPEVIITLLLIFAVWITTGILVFHMALRIPLMDYEIYSPSMLIVVCIGILVTCVMVVSLHVPEDKKDSSDDSKEATEDVEDQNIDNEEEDAERLRSKLRQIIASAFSYLLYKSLQKVFLFTCSMVLWYHPDWIITDDICAITSCGINLILTILLLRKMLHVILNGAPYSLDVHKVKAMLNDLDGVQHVHKLKLWSMEMDMLETAASVHIAVKDEKLIQNVMAEASKLLHDRFGLEEVTIQMEVYYNGMENHNCPL